MDKATFEAFKEIVYRESGIVISNEKKQLLENRLRKRLKALSLSSEKQYLEILESDLTGDELTQFLDVVSTNLTFFFRESSHFTHLANQLRAWDGKKPEIKIWCCAASTGEEPYAIAMTAAECLKQSSFKILATDICTKVLAKAIAGIYKQEQLEKVPNELVKKYFNAKGEVSQTLKSEITFKRFNLVKHPYPLKGNIDIIFCRNVMIYFDTPTRQKIITEFEKLLSNDGVLYIGQSENMLGINHSLKSYGSSVYGK
jgi:chemotaxis protein methyltransferase CheR